MTEEPLELFRKTKALLSGHFRLTSGLHSGQYFQCAKVLEHPAVAEELCSKIADCFQEYKPDVVIAPAIGGIIVGYEVARQLKARSLFAEREDGVMELRRGFELKRGDRVLVVEDVVTTGGSILEVRDLIKRKGGKAIGGACLVDRSGGQFDFGGEFCSVVSLEVRTFEPEACPLCKKGQPLVKPGSRQFKDA